MHDYLCTKPNPNDCGRRFYEHAHKPILKARENREGTPKQPRGNPRQPRGNSQATQV